MCKIQSLPRLVKVCNHQVEGHWLFNIRLLMPLNCQGTSDPQLNLAKLYRVIPLFTSLFNLIQKFFGAIKLWNLNVVQIKFLVVGEDYFEAHWEEGRGRRHFLHVFIVTGCKKADRTLVLEVKLFLDFCQIFFKNIDHFVIPLPFCSSNLFLQLSSYPLAYTLLLAEKLIKVFLVLQQARRHILFKYPLNGPTLKFLLLN